VAGEQWLGVWGQNGNPVAGLNAEVAQGARPPNSTVAKLGIGQPQRPVHDGDRSFEHQRRAIQIRSGRQRLERVIMGQRAPPAGP